MAYKAEVLALVRGVELAKSLDIKKLEIHMDNLACVQFLNGKENGRGLCTHELNRCRQLIDTEGWEVIITHVFREGNRAADWLANHGVSKACRLHILDSIPVDLSRILEEDVRGVALPRLAPP